MAFPLAARAAVVGPWGSGPAPSFDGSERPFLQYSASPGGTIHDRISIVNYGETPLTFDLYTADGFNTKNGAFALQAQGAPRHSVGAWIALPYPAVTVAPHTRDLVPFTLTVPLNATPGDHAGGVVALERIAALPPNQKEVFQRDGIGTRIFVRVIGPIRPALAITQLRINKTAPFLGGGHGMIIATVDNTGDTTLGGTATFKVSGGLGGAAHFRPVSIQTLLPGNSIQIEEPWSSLPFVGPATVTATVNYGTSSTEASTTTWFIPTVLKLVVGALVVAAAVWAIFRWRKRRAARRSQAEEPAPEPVAVGATSTASPLQPSDVPSE
jgi:hypothetical protein